MDFSLDKKHEMARTLFRDFAENEVKPLAQEVDETEVFPRGTVEKMQKYGFMGIPVPKEYGGQGCDPLTYVMCVEELSKVCATTGVIVSAHTSLCIDPILTYGTEEQKQKYVKALATGEKLGTPSIVFASAIEGFFLKMGFSESAGKVTFTVISLAVSAFCLTSLDTCCRLGRFTFQELFAAKEGEEDAHPVRKALSNTYVATLVNIGLAAILCVGGYATLWKLFGACNQLVSVPALMAAAVYLKSVGKKHNMFYIPMFFMAAASMSQLVISFVTYAKALINGTGAWNVEGLLCVFIVPIFCLAFSLLVEGCKVLFGKKTQAAA